MKVLILGATGMLGNAKFRFCLKILNLAFMVQLEAVVALDIFLKICWIVIISSLKSHTKEGLGEINLCFKIFRM